MVVLLSYPLYSRDSASAPPHFTPYIMKFSKSKVKNKKYTVITPKGKTIHFGDTRYEHYKDRIGIYSHLDHLDKERQRNYRARAKAIRNSKGELTYNNPEYSNYYSYHFLW